MLFNQYITAFVCTFLMNFIRFNFMVPQWVVEIIMQFASEKGRKHTRVMDRACPRTPVSAALGANSASNLEQTDSQNKSKSFDRHRDKGGGG